MKILYVITGLGTGGAERSLSDMVGPLGDLGVELQIATLEERTEGVQRQVSSDAAVTNVGSRLTTAVPRLRRLIRESQPDVIHTTIFEADLIGRLSSIGTGVPIASSIVNTSYSHGNVDHPDVNQSKLAVARLIDRITARRVKGFHAITAAAGDEAQRSLGIPAEKITVIPRGRSRERLGSASEQRRRDVRASLGLDDDTFVLLSVGRREHQKGQADAIGALSSLRAENPHMKLLIAGRDGSASKRLSEQVQREGLEDRVSFLGHREDVPDLMVAADLLVFPSLYEGFGGSLIEAMALDLPIVASDIPPIREVVGDTAVLVPPGTPDALADAISSLRSNSVEMSRLAQAAQARFEDRYQIDSVARRMLGFYEGLVSSS